MYLNSVGTGPCFCPFYKSYYTKSADKKPVLLILPFYPEIRFKGRCLTVLCFTVERPRNKSKKACKGAQAQFKAVLCTAFATEYQLCYNYGRRELLMSKMNFKYVRIQGKALARNTMHAKGIFSMCWQLIQDDVMDEEDAGLYKEIDDWFAENLPWPPQCKNQEPVVCWFKTENSEEMMKMIRPALWLLDRYNHPYYLVYTNYPGEIVYEDKYQVAAKTDGVLQIDDVQPSWSPE